MATSQLIRALGRPITSQPSLRYAASLRWRVVAADGRQSTARQFSVFKEFSNQLKGEAKSNPEFQKTVKDLNEKLGVVAEDLKVRTKKTAEKLYKSVDDVWTEAEATSKKVSVNVKEKLSAAKEEVSTNVKEKLSAAKEEVKETFGLRKNGSSESKYASASSIGETDGSSATTGTESPHFESNSKESAGQSDSIFGKFKSTFSSASSVVSSAYQKLKETKVSDFAKQGYDILKDELSSNPSRKRRNQYASPTKSSEVRSTRTDIVVLPSKQSRLGEKWDAFKKKMQGSPVFKHISGFSEPVVTKGQEIAEDMRERWETSDHPVVHKIQDLNDTVFGETSTALSFKEIRRRDPYFSLPDFVLEVQEMVRPVLTAYSKGDVETLKKYCSSEIIERCKGERAAYESQDIFFDNKILHISEVDVRETKMLGSTPFIVVGFQTQQIYCVRDRQGSIKEGGQDTIQQVHYLWAMQQIDAQELGEDALYPIWRLREIHQIGVQALI